MPGTAQNWGPFKQRVSRTVRWVATWSQAAQSLFSQALPPKPAQQSQRILTRQKIDDWKYAEWLKCKGGRSTNKFHKSQIRKLANLPNLLDLRTFRKCGIFRFATCEPNIFYGLQICDLRTQFLWRTWPTFSWFCHDMVDNGPNF